jgi:hypothetical protein
LAQVKKNRKNTTVLGRQELKEEEKVLGLSMGSEQG